MHLTVPQEIQMKAIIIHGTKGSPQGNWFPWLSNELQSLQVETQVPEMPRPENQSLESWLEAFKKQCGEPGQGTILIGHSIGAILVLRLLEKIHFPILCTVLVSAPYGDIGIPEYDLLNSSFFSKPFNWLSIRKHGGYIKFFMGDNDPYVPQKQLFDIAQALEVTPKIINNGGHLNAESGYTTFPLLLDFLSDFIRVARPTSR